MMGSGRSSIGSRITMKVFQYGRIRKRMVPIRPIICVIWFYQTAMERNSNNSSYFY